jgi:hypothetical protein
MGLCQTIGTSAAGNGGTSVAQETRAAATAVATNRLNEEQDCILFAGLFVELFFLLFG